MDSNDAILWKWKVSPTYDIVMFLADSLLRSAGRWVAWNAPAEILADAIFMTHYSICYLLARGLVRRCVIHVIVCVITFASIRYFSLLYRETFIHLCRAKNDIGIRHGLHIIWSIFSILHSHDKGFYICFIWAHAVMRPIAFTIYWYLHDSIEISRLTLIDIFCHGSPGHLY